MAPQQARRAGSGITLVARPWFAGFDSFTDILDPDLAPEPVLDLMLGELVHPFPFDVPINDKRRLIKGDGAGSARRTALGTSPRRAARQGEAPS
ncbi:hypothetical protein WMF38_26235 [Sorangium sp. So ce118]